MIGDLLHMSRRIDELEDDVEALTAKLTLEEDARTLAAHERDSYRGECDSLRTALSASQDREARLRGAMCSALESLHKGDQGTAECDATYRLDDALNDAPSPDLLGALRTAVDALKDIYAHAVPPFTTEKWVNYQRAVSGDTLRDLGPCLAKFGVDT